MDEHWHAQHHFGEQGMRDGQAGMLTPISFIALASIGLIALPMNRISTVLWWGVGLVGLVVLNRARTATDNGLDASLFTTFSTVALIVWIGSGICRMTRAALGAAPYSGKDIAAIGFLSICNAGFSSAAVYLVFMVSR